VEATRCPKYSAIIPPGICIRAYPTKNAVCKKPISTLVNPNSCIMVGVATDKLTRSIYDINVIKKISTAINHRKFVLFKQFTSYINLFPHIIPRYTIYHNYTKSCKININLCDLFSELPFVTLLVLVIFYILVYSIINKYGIHLFSAGEHCYTQDGFL